MRDLAIFELNKLEVIMDNTKQPARTVRELSGKETVDFLKIGKKYNTAESKTPKTIMVVFAMSRGTYVLETKDRGAITIVARRIIKEIFSRFSLPFLEPPFAVVWVMGTELSDVGFERGGKNEDSIYTFKN